MPDAVPPGGGAGVVLTGVGVGAGFAVGFALADLRRRRRGRALVGAFVDDGVALDEFAANAPAPAAVALAAAELETGALEAASDTTAEVDEAAPLALPGAPVAGPVGAAW